MPSALISADLLDEASRELVGLAQQLNPGAPRDDLLGMAMAALAALTPSGAAPDPWAAAALERVAEQLGWS